MKVIKKILTSLKNAFKPTNELEEYLSKSVDRTDFKSRMYQARRRGLL
jgi:hypothetical protein